MVTHDSRLYVLIFTAPKRKFVILDADTIIVVFGYFFITEPWCDDLSDMRNENEI